MGPRLRSRGRSAEDNEDDEEYDPDDRPERHWNTHLGTHWTSLPEVAKKFADGLYEKKRSAKERELEPGASTRPTWVSRNPRSIPLSSTWTRRLILLVKSISASRTRIMTGWKRRSLELSLQ